jgi:hypothetical protein
MRAVRNAVSDMTCSPMENANEGPEELEPPGVEKIGNNVQFVKLFMYIIDKQKQPPVA